MPNDDLELLLARIAIGDHDAFVQLYDCTAAKLHGVTYRVLANRNDAEDAVQEVYVKIWRNAERYQAEHGRALDWLVAVARNHAIDVLRARKRSSRDIDQTAYSDGPPPPTPETEALRTDERRRIDRCLAELSPDRAQAVRAAYLEGWSYKELARHHGVPLNTMRSWLRRALSVLRARLDDER
jgi:RNA polymerase sigma-70 factor (ECF subfamily)